MPGRTLFSSRLLWKINLIFVAIVLVSALLVAAFSAHRIRRSTLAEVEKNLLVRTALLAEIAAPAIKQGAFSELEKKIRRLGRETGTRMTVILGDGRVVADSEKNPQSMDNHADRPEIKKAALYAAGVSTRFSHTLKTGMMYYARTLRAGHDIVGYVRSALPLTRIDQRIAASRKTILFGIAVVALLILLTAWFMSRWFIRPLVEMTAMAEALAKGDFSRRIKLSRHDEIGRLAQSFNQVAENSRQRIETIAFDRQKLNAILSGMSEGVIAVDHEERIIHLNRAAAEFLGVEIEKVAGRPLWEVIRRPELLQAVKQAETSANGESGKNLRPGTLTLAHGSRERVFELHTAPLHDETGTRSGCVIVLHDISELHRLETIRRDFVVNASHELKTPITAIRALSETLLDDPAAMDDATRQSFLEKIHTQALRLSAITTDLMALSRFEQEASTGDGQSVDLEEIVRQAARDLEAAAERKKLDLEVEIEDRGLTVDGDPEALLQAVGNLLDNAVKYTPPTGRIRARLSRSGNEVIITVTDTGIGIEAKDQERIFERFYRVDKARSRELGGTGLGLAIVRHIVKNHHGRITVESRPGAGSSFHIYLPAGNSQP